MASNPLRLSDERDSSPELYEDRRLKTLAQWANTDGYKAMVDFVERKYRQLKHMVVSKDVDDETAIKLKWQAVGVYALLVDMDAEVGKLDEIERLKRDKVLDEKELLVQRMAMGSGHRRFSRDRNPGLGLNNPYD